jgi:hypothetical protein
VIPAGPVPTIPVPPAKAEGDIVPIIAVTPAVANPRSRIEPIAIAPSTGPVAEIAVTSPFTSPRLAAPLVVSAVYRVAVVEITVAVPRPAFAFPIGDTPCEIALPILKIAPCAIATLRIIDGGLPLGRPLPQTLAIRGCPAVGAWPCIIILAHLKKVAHLFVARTTNLIVLPHRLALWPGI